MGKYDDIGVPVPGQPASSGNFGIKVRDAIIDLDSRLVVGRVDTAILSADSATYGSTESGVLMSLEISAINGSRYAVWFKGNVGTDVANDLDVIRVREDSASGTQIDAGQRSIPTTSSVGVERYVYGEWTAASSGLKTFVVTGQRTGGTGTAHRIRAGTGRLAYLAVDRIA